MRADVRLCLVQDAEAFFIDMFEGSLRLDIAFAADFVHCKEGLQSFVR